MFSIKYANKTVVTPEDILTYNREQKKTLIQVTIHMYVEKIGTLSQRNYEIWPPTPST